jgi:hypothetical protein
MLFLDLCSSHEEGELLPKDTPYSVVNVQSSKLDISPQDFFGGNVSSTVHFSGFNGSLLKFI